MKDNKNIDDLFREKLEGFSPPPPPHLWQNVQNGLNAQRIHRRRMVAGWLAAAAVVLLALVGGWYFSGKLSPQNQLASKSEVVAPQHSTTQSKTTAETTEIEPALIHENVLTEPLSPTNRYDKPIETALIKNLKNKELNTGGPDRSGLDFPRLASRKVPSVINAIEVKLIEKTTKTERSDELTERERLLIAENLSIAQKPTEEENSWKMGMFVSPGYSSHTADHTDSYNRQMTYSGDNGNANVSGGFSVQYKTGKRWSVETGVYYAQNGQKSRSSQQLFSLSQSSDMVAAPENHYFTNAVRVDNGNMHMNSTAGVIAFSGNPKGAEIMGGFDELSYGKANALVSNGEFSQVFDFVEIPLYARYRVVDSDFGIELMGGVNAGLVVGNNAYIDNEFGLQKIGETQDISTVNFSGTIGLGLNYSLSKHFSVAVEPRLNYYLNSINTNPEVDFRPYRIGIFTGLSYEF